MSAVVGSLHVYPVKSLRGIAAGQAVVEPWGLRNDRRWLVLSPDGSGLTARKWHRMLGVIAVPQESGAITLTSRDATTLQVDPPVEGEFIPTAVSRLPSVRAASSEASEWLSSQLGIPVRLGWLDDPHRRTVSVEHGGRPGDALNLADAGPVLLTTSASLRQLDQWAHERAAETGEDSPAPIVMERFRPSVVVDGTAGPFVEDTWREVRIGSVEFRFAEHCDRCVLTTIDPETLITGKEPLRTLAKYRQWDHKTWFGIRLIPVTEGTIRVGDRVSGGPSLVGERS